MNKPKVYILIQISKIILLVSTGKMFHFIPVSWLAVRPSDSLSRALFVKSFVCLSYCKYHFHSTYTIFLHKNMRNNSRKSKQNVAYCCSIITWEVGGAYISPCTVHQNFNPAICPIGQSHISDIHISCI